MPSKSADNMKYLLALLFLVSCSPTTQNRESCYAGNELHASSRVLRECPGSWETCPARPEILRELSDNHAKCP
jgi:hypothetical protein